MRSASFSQHLERRRRHVDLTRPVPPNRGDRAPRTRSNRCPEREEVSAPGRRCGARAAAEKSACSKRSRSSGEGNPAPAAMAATKGRATRDRSHRPAGAIGLREPRTWPAIRRPVARRRRPPRRPPPGSARRRRPAVVAGQREGQFGSLAGPILGLDRAWRRSRRSGPGGRRPAAFCAPAARWRRSDRRTARPGRTIRPADRTRTRRCPSDISIESVRIVCPSRIRSRKNGSSAASQGRARASSRRRSRPPCRCERENRRSTWPAWRFEFDGGRVRPASSVARTTQLKPTGAAESLRSRPLPDRW